MPDAGAGEDVVIGGSGDDRIAGGAGEDRLFAAFGRDTITSRDGTRDVVAGGPGGDLARTDRADVRVSVP
jgi:Ca2+-binding RTX toxin-like protein